MSAHDSTPQNPSDPTGSVDSQQPGAAPEVAAAPTSSGADGEAPTDQAAVPPQADDDALVAALVEIERHVSSQGWDQPARLFALVRTDALIAQEPSLAQHLKANLPDSLSSIEQEDFKAGEDLVQTLARISWPASVSGCAVAVERVFLPAEFEDQIPADPQQAADFVAHHEQRQDVRVVVGALRDGATHGVARLVSNPDDLLGGTELVPGLARACLETLR